MVQSKEYLKIWKNRQQWKQLLPYILLALLSVGACWFFAGRYGIFGAKVDWISQHSVIPELFRQQFYDTGNFFPDFTLQAGGGQNIYNFAYYGLYSPAILLSYLFPFVSMSDYIMAVSVGSLALSIMLLHYWLSCRGFNRKICFGVSLLFLLAGPMIVQSYSQIMFVNYMPWLLLSFLGADRYLDFVKIIREEAKLHPMREGVRAHTILIIGVWGMILTSFYFSIRTVPIYKDGRKSRKRGKSDSLERFHKSGSRVCFFDGNLRFVKRNIACADCVFAHAGESYPVRLYMERSVISQNAGKRAVLSVLWCRTYYTPSYGIAYRAVLPEMAGTAVEPDQSGSSGDSGICMGFERRLIYPRKSMDSISAIILLYDCHIHKETDGETGKCKDKCRSISVDIAFCLACRYEI